MEHPEKRMGALARVLSRALRVEKDRLEAEDNDRPRGEPRGEMFLDDPQALETVVQRVLGKTAQIVEQRASAPVMMEELLAMPRGERESAVAVHPRFQTYSLASCILDRCDRVVSQDPAMARELAQLARAVAEQADPRVSGGSAALADLEAYSLAVEGNAERVANELREAHRTFLEARRVQEHGGADPDLAGRIDLLEASLRRDLRQFAAALDLLDKAERVFIALKDRNLHARTIINRANVFLVKRELDSVVMNLKRALPLAQDPWLALVVRHNLIFALAECGRPHEAAEFYNASKDLYLQFTDPLTTSRRIWAEGLIARELNEDLSLAKRLLSQAASSLAQHGYPLDAALAGLDLVTVYARRGETSEVLRVATNLLHLFQMEDLHPEAFAALKIIHEAAERESVNLSLLAKVTEKIRANQVRGNPAS